MLDNQFGFSLELCFAVTFDLLDYETLIYDEEVFVMLIAKFPTVTRLTLTAQCKSFAIIMTSFNVFKM